MSPRSLPRALLLVVTTCTLLSIVLHTAPAHAFDNEQMGQTTDVLVDELLDPKDPFWAPRRGERFELASYLGGEGAFAGIIPERLETIGGVDVSLIARYYPVDRLAVTLGTRGYFGLDGVPAAGTTATSLLSVLTGVRYDLVRENRFSLLWDVYSGPTLFAFADLFDAARSTNARLAIGGEAGSALALRYSLGPFTGELRGLAGGRAGAGQKSPFSAMYSGVDVGVTWSM